MEKKLYLSEAGRLALKKLEGFRDVIYKDQAAIDTVGWGHVVKKWELEKAKGWTKEHLEYMFSIDVRDAEYGVDEVITVELTQYEYDALVLLCYNIGSSNFGTSSLVKVVNKGKPYDANLILRKFKMWNKVTMNKKLVESKGLTNRRQIEANIFNGYDY